MMDDFDTLLARLRDCTIRAADLALGPSSGHAQHAGRETAVDQPGPATRAHESGVPWNDPSGAPLRDWLQMPPNDFYDKFKIAIVPMGCCYPGADAKGGDKPPCTKCARKWHPSPLAGLPNVELMILIGHYTQKRYLEKCRKKL
jgi:uracil-DNA glycosylase